jgi:hypothetical protein
LGGSRSSHFLLARLRGRPPLIAASGGELAQRSGERYVQTASFLREDPYDAMNDALLSFLDNLARDYLATPPSLLRSVAA